MAYVERCDIHDRLHCGPAWIGYVTLSKSGRSVYYRGMHLVPGGARNHRDEATGVEYWVTGVKKRGSNRHPQGGSGPIHIDDDVRAEYEAWRGEEKKK